MAKAIRHIHRERKVIIEKRPDGVNLRLTEDEARTLLDITGMIGGDRQKSRRRHTDAIGEALRKVGIEPTYNHQDWWPVDVHHTYRAIYFDDE